MRSAGWGVAVVVVLASAGCATMPEVMTLTPSAPATPGTTASGTTTPDGGSSTTPGGACAAFAADLAPQEQAGQLVMAGIFDNLDSTERGKLAAKPYGSTILLGSQGEGMQRLQGRTEALAEYGTVAGMLVAADQEGGRVQRITGPGFDTIPSAREQAGMSADDLTSAATTWGEQLAEAGILLDLAPVADTVPEGMEKTNQPIGALSRGYGSDPEDVASHVTAFIDGMHAAGVATSAKHFPNLGAVEGNTDHVGGVVDSVTTADDPALEPFRAAVAAGTETVMVSTATYDTIDPDRMAAFSPTVIGLLRDDLGFSGVVISDDLGAAASVADIPGGERAVRFVRAGGDLAISADLDIAAQMVDALVAEAESDPEFAQRLAQSATRVLDLKRGLGVTTCGAD